MMCNGGSHWLVEETGRWERVAHAQRTCPHCQGWLEVIRNTLFLCHVNLPVRARLRNLPTVHTFLEQDSLLGATFVAKCQRTHPTAATIALGKGWAVGPTPE
jgi:hypothetical protein